MTAWICRTCGVEHADTPAPPAVCLICSDERQYVLPTGQRWTTLDELSTEGRRGAVENVEAGLFGVTVTPKVGIGQRNCCCRRRRGTCCGTPSDMSMTTSRPQWRRWVVSRS